MDTCPKSREKFVDLDKCVSLIEEISTKLDPQTEQDEARCSSDAEVLVEKFKKFINHYQEQPELLDPYLSTLIHRLTEGLTDSNISSIRYHTIFKFLYQLIKVSGFKSIGKQFPHETDKLPLITELLNRESPEIKHNWETRYVLTVWLSIVILTPFDLTKFDPDPSQESISTKIYSTLIDNLSSFDSCQHVTSYCLAKFFSRPDVLKSDKKTVDDFIKIALQELGQIKFGAGVGSMDDVKLIGYLRTLAYMFEFLPREDMKERCKQILDELIKLNVDKINRELINHLIIKLIQRAGLAFLPKRIAPWRYKRGCRILGQVTNKNHQAVGSYVDQDIESQQLNNEEEVHCAEYMESILSVLFLATQNGQTRIRLSAAKGIARLASRLSKERASDVIDMVLENFFDSKNSSEFAWHGGTLALAELSRNGLILEEKLATVVRIVGDAIIYDKIKGSFAVGAHVREGACYVCWAMARTYEDHLLAPHIPSISLNLMCTMLFDREVHCRRAASAAFQELVGRQGTFNEEGISILNSVDYQNVGVRQLTYLQLAPQVASLNSGKYVVPFVEHLLDKKIGHWDIEIRRLASDSLGALMLHSEKDFVRTKVIPELIKMSEQSVDNVKHGAILAIAKVVQSLVPLQFDFSQELIDFMGGIVKQCSKQLSNKIQAPKFIEAIGYIISSCEIASFKFNDDVIKQWEVTALSALDSDKSQLRDIGSEALLTLYKTYYRDNKTCQDRLLTTLNKSLTSANENSRCGGLRALSKLSRVPSSYIHESSIRLDADTPGIILMSMTSYISKETCEKSPSGDILFADAKAEACKALVNFVCNLDKDRLVSELNLIRASYDALLEKTEDYSLDKRGDIGVVVRRAAIKALEELTLHLLAINLTSMFDSCLVGKIITKCAQQAVSYHDSTRELASQTFYKLVTNSSIPSDSIPHREYILSLFDKYQAHDAEFNWRDKSAPIFVSLLGEKEYNRDLWIGLIPSVGQVSDLFAEQFRIALYEYIQSLSASKDKKKQEELEFVFESFIECLDGKHALGERLLTFGLTAADYLLTRGLMNETSEGFQKHLASFCWQSAVGKASDVKRLVNVARVLSSMLQFNGQVQRSCLKYCLQLLVNRYARVRVYTAEQLYLSIMTYADELEACSSDSAAAVSATEEVELAEGDSQANDLDEEGGGVVGAMGAEGKKVEGSMDLSGALELLSQTDWSKPLEEVKPFRDQICAHLMLASEVSGSS